MEQKSTVGEDLKDKVYSREEYARANFWEDRYVENGGFFDWYAEFPELKVSFDEYGIEKEDKILMVGCGNSKLSDQMYQNGYQNIVNIDISPTVIEQMKGKFPYMVWEVMDATKMTYPDGYFDVIIDKGTLDALISGKCYQICEAMLKECMRVTKEAGQLILITYGSPEGRFENALQFHQYDYYQCRAELNDLSTMINLMRSNLPGQQLSNILKQQDAFLRTLKEFTIIKMMRRSRKNQKQYIVWNKYEPAELQVQNNHVEQPKTAKQKPSKEQQVQQQPASKQKQFNYKPKKQPYVYVYSIKRKFTLGIDQQPSVQGSKNQYGDITVKGQNEEQAFTFIAKDGLYNQILKGVNFAIKNKHIPTPNIMITSLLERHIPHSVILNIIEDQSSKMLCLRKTNFNIKITLTPKQKCEAILSELPKIVRKLIDKCLLHPSPQVYNLFSVLKERKILPTINELLQKYWYPTWRINSINNQYLSLQFSIPPLLSQKETQLLEVLKSSLKGYKVEICQMRKGFLSFLDFALFNIVSMACVSYTSQKANLLIQEFWEKGHGFEELNAVKDSEYNQIIPTLLTRGGIVSKVAAHITALY